LLPGTTQQNETDRMAAKNTVLVAHHDSATRDLFREALDKEVFDTIITDKGTEARELFETLGDRLDALVLDSQLPDGDPYELLAEFRKGTSDAEIVVVVNEVNEDAFSRALGAGAFDFLVQPFSKLAAQQMLRNAVERRRCRRLTADLVSTKRSLEVELTVKSFQIDQVRELVNFSRLVNEHLRLDAILDITFERLPELVNAETFSLFLYEPSRNEFHLAITNRPNLDPREPIVVKEENSPIMKRAIETHQVLFIDDVLKSGLLPDEQARTAKSRHYKKKHSVCLPLKVEDRPIGVLNLNDFRAEEQIQDYINVAVLAAAFLAPVISNARLYEQVEETANRDGLTQLYNRAFFDKNLGENFRRAARYGRPLSLLFLDIDHFKQLNDTYGHQAGDMVLRRVAARLLDNSRKGIDVAARYGGEEMVLIGPETPADGIKIVAERIRQDIEAMRVKFRNESGEKTLSVTVSIGTATYLPGVSDYPSERALTEAADSAMYQAKHSGRNRCSHHNG